MDGSGQVPMSGKLSVERRTEDATGFFFHGMSMLSRADPQPTLQVLAYVSYRDGSYSAPRSQCHIIVSNASIAVKIHIASAQHRAA